MERNSALDFIKGLAVVIMIFANTAPYFFNFESEFFIRIIFSVAAPIFIISSGYITQINISNPELKKSKIIYRIFQILFFAVVIDTLFWHSIPFITFDVLYLIGFSQLILLIINKKYLIFITSAVFVLSLIVNQYLNYRFSINELTSFSISSLIEANPIKRMLFDGWFPLLPWLSFFLLGSISFIYLKDKLKSRLAFLQIGLTLLVMYFISGDIPKIRNSYLELWYPLNGLALLIPFGVFFSINGLLNYKIKVDSIISKLIIIIGKNSLFVYTFQAFIICIIIENKLLQNLTMTQKIGSFYLVIIFVLVIVFIFQKIKNYSFWLKTPKMIKFLLCN